MTTFRDQKRQARQQLHQALSEPALYFPERTGDPIEVTVRLHLRFSLLGDLLATRVGFGDAHEMTPRIIFWNAEVRPTRDAYVITKDMGAFLIDTVQDPDDVTTTAYVSQVLPETARRYDWDPDALWLGFAAPGTEPDPGEGP